jgi:hypothetical protein
MGAISFGEARQSSTILFSRAVLGPRTGRKSDLPASRPRPFFTLPRVNEK